MVDDEVCIEINRRANDSYKTVLGLKKYIYPICVIYTFCIIAWFAAETLQEIFLRHLAALLVPPDTSAVAAFVAAWVLAAWIIGDKCRSILGYRRHVRIWKTIRDLDFCPPALYLIAIQYAVVLSIFIGVWNNGYISLWLFKGDFVLALLVIAYSRDIYAEMPKEDKCMDGLVPDRLSSQVKIAELRNKVEAYFEFEREREPGRDEKLILVKGARGAGKSYIVKHALAEFMKSEAKTFVLCIQPWYTDREQDFYLDVVSRMVKNIAIHYEVPFDNDSAKKLIDQYVPDSYSIDKIIKIAVKMLSSNMEYGSLINKMSANGYKFILVFDDLDRGTAEDVRRVFRVVDALSGQAGLLVIMVADQASLLRYDRYISRPEMPVKVAK